MPMAIKQAMDVWFSICRPQPLYRELIHAARTRQRRRADQAAIINHKRRRGEPSQSQIIAVDAEFTMFKSTMEAAPPALEGFDGFA